MRKLLLRVSSQIIAPKQCGIVSSSGCMMALSSSHKLANMKEIGRREYSTHHHGCSRVDKECPRVTRKASNDHPHSCWNCDSELPCDMLFCEHCNKIQPPESSASEEHQMDYFTLMDMPQEFSVNPKLLHEKFKELQRVLHPDLYALKSDMEKKISRMQSSIVNAAYQTLKSTKLRAEYLLKLRERNMYGACSKKSVNDVQLSPEFLMEVMEVNEKIGEYELNRDELTEIQMEFNEKKRLSVKSIDENFKLNDLDGVRYHIAQLNYLERTLQLVDNKLHQMDLKEHSVPDECKNCEHNQ